MSKFLLKLFGGIITNQLALIAFCAVGLPAAAHPDKLYGWMTQYVHLPDTRLVRFVCGKAFMLPWGSVGLHAFDLVGKFLILWELIWITGARLVLPISSEWRPDPFDTTQYPDLFSKPALRTSLTEFWAKGQFSSPKYPPCYLSQMLTKLYLLPMQVGSLPSEETSSSAAQNRLANYFLRMD
jgi:hypothetical protein